MSVTHAENNAPAAKALSPMFGVRTYVYVHDMQTISAALIVFQLLAEEDDKLRFFIAPFVSSRFGVLVYLKSCKMGGIFKTIWWFANIMVW